MAVENWRNINESVKKKANQYVCNRKMWRDNVNGVINNQ